MNKVGVEVNTASAPLLSQVAGIGPSLARSIVLHRAAKGPFKVAVGTKVVAEVAVNGKPAVAARFTLK